MTLYLQALFQKELVGTPNGSWPLSASQSDRSRAASRSGRQPESAVYERSPAGQRRPRLTQARNDLQLALLDLSQALNRESAAGFDIATPRLDSLSLEALHRLGTADEVYAYAVEYRPAIRAERLRLERSEYTVRTARSALYPSLSLRGGYGTGSTAAWRRASARSSAATAANSSASR